jgi:8-oxo-dGTP diphosphatase
MAGEPAALIEGPVTPVPEVEVAAGVLIDDQGRVLLARRPVGKVYSGYWEFPGGKVEPGETVRQALDRELHEELGIEVTEADPWISQHFSYPHALVHIRFFRVRAWRGEVRAIEHDGLAWQRPGQFDLEPMLPANTPVLRSLSLPEVYAISDVANPGPTGFLDALDRQLARGLRLLQWREPTLAAADQQALLSEVIRRCHAVGARVLVNSACALAGPSRADGVHLTARALRECTQRPDLPWVSASCHDAEELAMAARLGVDWVVLGPVAATRSHPGVAGMGWDRFESLVRDLPMPVYAIGGMRHDDAAMARSHGAHGLAMISAVWAQSRSDRG